MKKIAFSIACLFSLALVAPSCEDILSTESARYDTENSLSSANDSVYSVLGVLRQMQNLSERYVLLGEMRGDLLDVNDRTTSSIRELNNFTVSDTNAYANPRDYYEIINNCNYFISQTSDETSPLKRENALMRTLRAWVYMQVGFNWGKAYYMTEPLLSLADVEDAQKNAPTYTLSELIDALILDLEPFAESAYPNYGAINSFESRYLFIPAKLVLADLYLWRGRTTEDYEKAATYYAEVIDEESTGSYQPTIYHSTSTFETPIIGDSWSSAVMNLSSSGVSSEWIALIQMSASVTDGMINSIPTKVDQFGIAEGLLELWQEQSYLLRLINNNVATTYPTIGDLREFANRMEVTYNSAAETKQYLLPKKLYNMVHAQIYRKGLVHLRYAEALNRIGKPETAFAVLKYSLNPIVLVPTAGYISPDELADRKPYITVFEKEKYDPVILTGGIHGRGCGESAYDPLYTIVQSGEILETKEDSIRRVEDLICDELALETSFEGNRFPDLMRIALRRNDPAFLAAKVAAKHADYNRMYELLSDPKNWFLPLPAAD